MELLVGFALGIAANLVAAGLLATVGDRIIGFFSGPSFNLSGVWLAVFEPISPRPSTTVEVVTIVHCRDTVRLRLENHNNVRESALRLRGYGKYRSAQLSAVYYLIGKAKQDSGALVLRSRSTGGANTVLSGVYTQVHDREETESVEVKTEPYTLRRMVLPLRRRVRRLWRGFYFEDWDDFKRWSVEAGCWDGRSATDTSAARSG